MKLALFDIDGTLLLTGGATRRAMVRAGRTCFGSAFEWKPVTTGLLDPELLRDLIAANGIEADIHALSRMRDAYVGAFLHEVDVARNDVEVLPGVHALLVALRAQQPPENVGVGVLTGNLRRVAMAKLDAAGLESHRFDVICTGEDAATRPGLVPLAIERMLAVHRIRVAPADIVVIGDTPRDVDCAHAHGCVAVAVATGHFDADTLARAGADLVLPNLADASPLVALLRS